MPVLMQQFSFQIYIVLSAMARFAHCLRSGKWTARLAKVLQRSTFKSWISECTIHSITLTKNKRGQGVHAEDLPLTSEIFKAQLMDVFGRLEA